MILTKQQRTALKRIYLRDIKNISYLAFRRTVQLGYDCIMINTGSIWLGIESDGYTHS